MIQFCLDFSRQFWIRLLSELCTVPRLYPFRRPLILLLAALLAGIFWTRQTGGLDPARDWLPLDGERGAVVGIVRGQPDERPSGAVHDIAVETLQVAGGPLENARGRVQVHVLRSTQSFAAPGDRVRVFGRFSVPPPARTPGAFDHRAFLRARNTGAILYAGERGWEILGPSGQRPLQRLGAQIEERVAAAFDRHLTPESAAVMSGLTVGRRPRFHPEVRDALLESGTMHVLVASGSNVGFLLAGLCVAAAAAGLRRETALLLALPAVWLYALVVGGDAPITRAAVMATVFVGANLVGREDRPYHALALAGLILLAADPSSAFDVGMQMSFLTVFGFMYHLAPLEEAIMPLRSWARWMARAVAASLIAQIWLLPISAGIFHRLYPIAIPANLLVVPAASAGLGVGFGLAAIDILAPALAAPVARLAEFYAGGLLAIARFFAAHPGVSVWLPSPHPAQTAGLFAALLALPHVRKSLLAAGLMTGGIAVMAFVRPAPLARPVDWGVAWLDTGARTTAVVRVGKREAIVINPGPHEPADTSERVLGPFLTESGVRRVVAVVITDRRTTSDDVDALRKVIPVDRVHDLTNDPAPRSLTVAGLAFTPLPAPAYAGERPLWVSRHGRAVLLGHRMELETQGAALTRREQLAAIQGRFRPDAVWSPAFVRRGRGALMVESAGASKESRPPWPGTPVRPQTAGWHWLDLSASPD